MVAVGPERGLWRRERRALKSAFGATSPKGYRIAAARTIASPRGNRLIRHVRQHSYTPGLCLRSIHQKVGKPQGRAQVVTWK